MQNYRFYTFKKCWLTLSTDLRLAMHQSSLDRQPKASCHPLVENFGATSQLKMVLLITERNVALTI